MNTQHTDEVFLDKCRRNLAILWFCGGGVLYLLLIIQSVFGFYGNDENSVREVWAWFLPNILPTLSLIIGSTFTLGHTRSSEKISRFAAGFCCCLSAGYLLTLGFTMFLVPLPHEFGIKVFANRLEFLNNSSLWLAPFQGLVCAALGVVLVSKRSSIKNQSSDNNSAIEISD